MPVTPNPAHPFMPLSKHIRDVILASLADKDVLMYEASSALWKNKILGSHSLKCESGGRMDNWNTMTQSIPNDTWTKVDMTEIVFDLNTEFTLANDRFTAKTAGYYLVIAYGCILASVAGTYFQVQLAKNGVAYDYSSRFYAVIDGNQWLGGSLLALVSLAANDYLEMFVYQNSGAAQNERGSHLTVMKLGI